MQQPSPHGTPQEWQQQQQQHNNGLQQPSDSSPAAALRRQQPTDDADPEPADTAVLIDSSSETQSQAAARQQYTKQVSFPPDDTLATVHQLHPSSSAGDLAPWSEEAAAVAGDEQEGGCSALPQAAMPKPAQCKNTRCCSCIGSSKCMLLPLVAGSTMHTHT